MTVALVALFGALGSVMRYGAGLLGIRLFGSTLPAGTFAVNLIGSTAIGLAMAWFAQRGTLASDARIAITTGLLGGFTTYSAFCFETYALLQRGAILGAVAYVALTLVACLTGCLLGVWLASAL